MFVKNQERFFLLGIILKPGKNKKPLNNESSGFGEAIYSIHEYLKTIRSSSLPPIKRIGELN